MLTSFFGKSKPLNFLVLGCIIVFGGLVSYFFGAEGSYETLKILKVALALFGSIFGMLLLDFIIRKNELAKPNNYGIFFYVAFLIIFPFYLTTPKLLGVSLLLLLALRRILSLSSHKNSQKKILDAALYITLASFIEFYAVLFFLVLYISIVRNGLANFKNYLIPLVGFGAIWVLAITYYFLAQDTFVNLYSSLPSLSLDFKNYNKIELLLPLTILLTLLVWTGFGVLKKFAVVPRKKKPTLTVLLMAVVVSITICALSSFKNGTELVFVFAPAAVLCSNYIEHSKEVWFKEVLLWLMVVLAIGQFFV